MWMYTHGHIILLDTSRTTAAAAAVSCMSSGPHQVLCVQVPPVLYYCSVSRYSGGSPICCGYVPDYQNPVDRVIKLVSAVHRYTAGIALCTVNVQHHIVVFK